MPLRGCATLYPVHRLPEFARRHGVCSTLPVLREEAARPASVHGAFHLAQETCVCCWQSQESSAPPGGVTGHGTRKMSTSWAQMAGVDPSKICQVTPWASTDVFTYITGSLCDMTTARTSVAGSCISLLHPLRKALYSATWVLLPSGAVIELRGVPDAADFPLRQSYRVPGMRFRIGTDRYQLCPP